MRNRSSEERRRRECAPHDKPSARSPKTRAVSKSLAEHYVDALGLELHVDGWLWSTEWRKRRDGQMRPGPRGWLATKYPVRLTTLRCALAGEWGLDLREQRTVKYIGIDIDCHDINGTPDADEGIDAWLDDRRGHATWRRKRERIATRVRPIVEATRATTPKAHWVALESPRGLHLMTLLDDPLTIAQAEKLGQAVIAAIGNPAGVDKVFPSTQAGGRTFRLPLTGGSRLVKDDLVGPKHARRVNDVIDLLAAPRTRLADLVGALEAVIPEYDPNADGAERSTAPRQRPRPPEPIDVQKCDGDLPGDGELRARLHEHLRGIEAGQAGAAEGCRCD